VHSRAADRRKTHRDKAERVKARDFSATEKTNHDKRNAKGATARLPENARPGDVLRRHEFICSDKASIPRAAYAVGAFADCCAFCAVVLKNVVTAFTAE
jgi:hypothetical protein